MVLLQHASVDIQGALFRLTGYQRKMVT